MEKIPHLLLNSFLGWFFAYKNVWGKMNILSL